jgi:hypothetical protein
MKVWLAGSMMLLGMLAACGDDGIGGGGGKLVKPDGSACGDAERSGVTACTASANGQCQAGQYCNSEQLTCSVGCTSDNNCAGNQYCDIAEGVGTCRNCVVQQTTVEPGGSPCDDAGGKVRACGASAADAAGFVAGCKDFMADEEFKPLMEAILDCVDLAGTDCAEQAECLDDEDADDFDGEFEDMP